MNQSEAEANKGFQWAITNLSVFGVIVKFPPVIGFRLKSRKTYFWVKSTLLKSTDVWPSSTNLFKL